MERARREGQPGEKDIQSGKELEDKQAENGIYGA